ncbi:MAG: DHA2 family efflux MFS transporter permease subunit, partial [Pseudolysinimonas sp.]
MSASITVRPGSAGGTRRGLAMGILIFASFMDLLDVTIVQVALPTIREDLGATPAQLEWIVSGYMLAFAVVLVTGGRLGDILGRQRTFLIGVAGFTVASVVASLAASGDLLVATRVAQGGFAALMVPQALSTLQALYTPKERAPMYGIIGGVSGLAAVIGPVLGGWLVSADIAGLGWRTIFLLNVPVGVAIFALAARFVPNTRSPHPLRLDILGVVLLTGALLGMLYPVVEGRSLGWPAWLGVIAAAGVVMAVAFVFVERAKERRDGSSLLPMSLFGNRGFSAGLVTQASFQGAMNAFTVAWIIYIQAVLGFDAFAAGLTLLPFSIGAFIGVGVAVPLASRVGKPIVTIGALIQAGGVAWAIAIMTDRGAALTGWELVPPLLAMGIGLGLLVVPLIDIALANVALRDAGAASGTYGTFQQIGAAVGVAVAGTVFFSEIGTDFSQPNVMAALTSASSIAIGGYLLSAVASLLLPKRADVLRHADEAARV